MEKNQEGFEIRLNCPAHDPNCLGEYNDIAVDVPPRTSMGGGGLIKYPYRHLRGVAHLGQ